MGRLRRGWGHQSGMGIRTAEFGQELAGCGTDGEFTSPVAGCEEDEHGMRGTAAQMGCREVPGFNTKPEFQDVG